MEILHTYPQMADRGVIIIIASVAMMLISLFFGASFLDEKKVKQGSICGVIILSILLALIVNFNKLPRDTYHDVNISSLSEFDYDKYKIYEQKGKIITIKEVNN